jgi:hypothetical protein
MLDNQIMINYKYNERRVMNLLDSKVIIGMSISG